MATAIPHITYRPAIDGLRAIAVISVFIFHLNKTWLPGGFVGVDVFFVISGYLITSIILKDLHNGSFTIAGFYQRRIARIFPAFFTVGLVTVAVASYFYSSQDFASVGESLTAASLSIVNMQLMLQGNYFTVSPDSMPFLHYWSLSVEEQFYIFYPLFLVFLYKSCRKRLFLILCVFCGFSLLACVIYTTFRPIRAFYFLPTRAWELFAGCLLAIQTDSKPSPKIRWAVSGGVLAIGLSLLLVPGGPAFPGFWALLPVLGTVGVLMAPANGVSERCLSAPPLVLLGKMSYSIYLWHWPIFSLVDYKMFLASETTRLVVKIVLSLSAATLSYWIIENPARRFLNRQESRHLAYCFLVLALALCIPMGIFISKTMYVYANLRDVRNGGLVFVGGSNVKSVVLMGDSHGAMYGKVMRDICKSRDGRLVVISVPAGLPLPASDNEFSQLWLDSLTVVKREKPDCLVLACSWTSQLKYDKERLSIAIEALRPYVGHFVLINQIPLLPNDANRASMRRGLRPPFYEDAEVSQRRIEMNGFLERYNSPQCKIVRVESHFIHGERELLFFDEHGNELYQDWQHLSGAGADLIRSELENAIYGESSGR